MTTESQDVPGFDELRIGDSFEWERVTITLIAQGAPNYWYGEDAGSRITICRSAWGIQAHNITNYRRAADPTPIAELVDQKMAEMEREQAQAAPHPGYDRKDPFGNVIDEVTINTRQRQHDDAYAQRQEQDKQNILRAMREPWRPGTNGLGAISCSMFKEWRRL